MNFALNLVDWEARAPGLSETAQWMDWACRELPVDPAAPQAKLTALPMMTARVSPPAAVWRSSAG